VDRQPRARNERLPLEAIMGKTTGGKDTRKREAFGEGDTGAESVRLQFITRQPVGTSITAKFKWGGAS